MQIKIDYRERKLISTLQALNRENNNNIEITTENLPIGDIVILDGDKELLIIERKTLTDLASSLQDGRYAEQSYRLNAHPLHNHNIVYLIEGMMNFDDSFNKYTKIKAETLRTCMFSLTYFKGFTVTRTYTMIGTAKYIIRVVNKLKREKGKKKSYYDVNNSHEVPNYNTVVKKTKKNNITPENISEIILSQIPSISEKTASAIMSDFTSLFHLINSLRLNPNCLDKIKFMTTGGRQRRISRKSIENVKKYLLFRSGNIIDVET